MKPVKKRLTKAQINRINAARKAAASKPKVAVQKVPLSAKSRLPLVKVGRQAAQARAAQREQNVSRKLKTMTSGLRLTSGAVLSVDAQLNAAGKCVYHCLCACGATITKTPKAMRKVLTEGVVQCGKCAPPKQPKPEKQPELVVSLRTVWEQLAAGHTDYDSFYQRYVTDNRGLKAALGNPRIIPVEYTGRKRETQALTLAMVGYLIKKGYAVYKEMAVTDYATRRVDVCGINLHGHIIIAEVKSCLADYRADKKMHEYLPYCNQMYVVFPYTMKIPKALSDEITAKGIGIMVLQKTGLTRVYKRAKYRQVDPAQLKRLTMRMVWRSAVLSKRTSKRVKVFL